MFLIIFFAVVFTLGASKPRKLTIAPVSPRIQSLGHTTESLQPTINGLLSPHANHELKPSQCAGFLDLFKNTPEGEMASKYVDPHAPLSPQTLQRYALLMHIFASHDPVVRLDPYASKLYVSQRLSVYNFGKEVVLTEKQSRGCLDRLMRRVQSWLP